MALAVLCVAATIACFDQSAVTVSELISLSPEEHRRTLFDHMTEGRLLNVKSEQYQSVPSGNIPQRLTTETWLGADPHGTFVTAVTKASFPDGPTTMDMLGVHGRQTLSEWLDQAWQMAGWAERAGAEFKGHGALHGWDSLIYEWETGAGIQRLEIVADAPLIARDSSHAINEQGALELLRSNSVLEYQLLPPGSKPPVVDGH